MQEYECLVLGAGPAGLSTAKHLAERGVSFLVLEKNEGIDARKSWVTWDEEVKKEGLEDCILSVPDSFVFRSYLGPRYVFEKPGSVLVSEEKILKTLAGPVKEKIKFLTEVVSWSESDQMYAVKTSKGSFKAKYIVDAMGNHSPILEGTKRTCNRFMGCFSYMLEGIKVKKPGEVMIYDSYLPGKYHFWTIPYSERKALVGAFAWFGLEKGGFENALKRYIKYQDLFEGKGKIVGTKAGNIPLEPMQKPAEGNMLFVGDSASQALPSSGFSFHRVIKAGRLAADAVSEGDPGKYANEWEREQGIGITTHSIISQIIANVSNKKLAEQIDYMKNLPHDLLYQFLTGSDMSVRFSQKLLGHAYNNFSLNELKDLIRPEEYLAIISKTYNEVWNYTRNFVRNAIP